MATLASRLFAQLRADLNGDGKVTADEKAKTTPAAPPAETAPRFTRKNQMPQRKNQMPQRKNEMPTRKGNLTRKPPEAY